MSAPRTDWVREPSARADPAGVRECLSSDAALPSANIPPVARSGWRGVPTALGTATLRSAILRTRIHKISQESSRDHHITGVATALSHSVYPLRVIATFSIQGGLPSQSLSLPAGTGGGLGKVPLWQGEDPLALVAHLPVAEAAAPRRPPCPQSAVGRGRRHVPQPARRGHHLVAAEGVHWPREDAVGQIPVSELGSGRTPRTEGVER